MSYFFSIFGNEPTFTIMLFPTSSNWMVCKNKEKGLQGKILCPSSFLLEWFAKTKKRDFLQRQVSLSRPDCCRWLQVQLGLRTNHGREQKNSNNQLLAKSGAKGHRRQNRSKENQPKRQRRGISGQWRERERKVQLDTEGISFFRLSKRIVGYVGTDDPLWYLAN